MAHSGPEVLSYTNEMKISLLTPISNFINYYFISNQYFIIKAKSNFSLLCKLSLLQPYVEVSKDGNNKTVISDSFKRYHTKFQIYHISTLDKLGVPGKWFQTTPSTTTTFQLPLRGHARGLGQRLMGKYTSQKPSSRLWSSTYRLLPLPPSSANSVSPPATDVHCAVFFYTKC